MAINFQILLFIFFFFLKGAYKIEVSQGSRAVRGSPYMCQVFDASKVKIHEVKKPITLNVPTSVKRKTFFVCVLPVEF